MANEEVTRMVEREQLGESIGGPRRITKETLPNYHDWPLWRKTSLTHATRVVGPFVVETSEGDLECRDGWVAVDARGYPYPIAADEFAMIYEPAGDEQPKTAQAPRELTDEERQRDSFRVAALRSLEDIAGDTQAENPERMHAAKTILEHTAEQSSGWPALLGIPR